MSHSSTNLNLNSVTKVSRNLINAPEFGSRLLGDQEIEQITKVIRSGSLFRYSGTSTQNQSLQFEESISELFDRSAHLVSSGTAGLRAALVAAGVVQGDTVLVSAFTFVATASAVVALGAIPVPVDVTHGLGMNLEDLSEKAEGAKAVIGVYAPGYPSNQRAVFDFTKTHGLTLIEDACQAFCVRTNGELAGTIGDFGVFSFQQGKQLCSGEGGLVIAHSDLLARVRSYSDHGCSRTSCNRPIWSENAQFGDNLRITELQSAVLNVQLTSLPSMISRQRDIFFELSHRYQNVINLVPCLDREGCTGSNLLFYAPTNKVADQLIMAARNYGVCMKYVWSTPFHLSPAFRSLPSANLPRTPIAEDIAARLLSIPLPPLEGAVVDAVIAGLDNALEEVL